MKSDKFSSLGSTFLLTIGSSLGQVINFLFMAYITRIYSPDDFGLLASFVSISALVGVASAGKYDVAIVVAREREQAISLLRLAFLVTLVFSAVLLSLMVLLGPSFKDSMNHPERFEWFMYMPLSLVFLSFTQIYWMWDVRERNYADLSVVRIVEAMVTGIITALSFRMGASGLILGLISGQAASTLFLGLRSGIKERLNPFVFKKDELLKQARSFSSFPKYNILQGGCDIFLSIGVMVVGTFYFPASFIGLYSLGFRVLQAPMSLVVKPISHVFFSDASSAWRQGRGFHSITLTAVKRTAAIAAVIPITLLLFAPALFSFCFGSAWREAGEFARILSPWLFLELIKAPLAQIPAILGKQKKVMQLSLGASLLLAISVVVCGIWFRSDTYLCLGIISLYQSIQTLAFIAMFLRMSKFAVPG